MSLNNQAEIAIISRRVREAIELLFSDCSLPRDTFLKERIAENKDGCKFRLVSLSEILNSFLKMSISRPLHNLTEFNKLPPI